MTSHLLSLHTCAVLQMPIHERKERGRKKERRKEGGKEREGGKKEEERERNKSGCFVSLQVHGHSSVNIT